MSESQQHFQRASFLLVGRIYEDEAIFKIIQEAISIVTKRIEASFYFTDERTYKKVVTLHPKVISLEFIPSEHQTKIDYIVTIGGDGTILYAAKEFKKVVPPVVTFQRVFFNLNGKHILEVNQLSQKSHLVAVLGESYHAIVSYKKKYQRLKHQQIGESLHKLTHERITVQIKVNDQILTNTAGDGILISTPTGSTAYSLSAGGPIIENGVNGILIVPISPNSLSFRPICLPSTATITIKLHHSSRSQAFASFDGQSVEQFGFDHQIVIKRSNHDVIFYKPKKGEEQMPPWIYRLKIFLGWNEKLKPPQYYSPEKLKNPLQCNEGD